MLQVRPVQPVLTAGRLAVLGQPFVQPQGDIGDRRVQVTVRDLVAQVFGHTVAPLGVDLQARVRLQEERPALGELGVAQAHELSELLGAAEQKHVDRLVGAGQTELLAQVGPPRGQLLQQPVIGGQGEIAVEDQLSAHDGVLVGQQEPLRPDGRAPPRPRQHAERKPHEPSERRC